MKFRITFYARQNLALGIRSEYQQIVEAESLEKAVLKLYDLYEHIRVVSYHEIKNGGVPKIEVRDKAATLGTVTPQHPPPPTFGDE